jgi:hypothetical protein
MTMTTTNTPTLTIYHAAVLTLAFLHGARAFGPTSSPSRPSLPRTALFGQRHRGGGGGGGGGSRRDFVDRAGASIAAACGAAASSVSARPARAAAAADVDTENFLRSGMVSMPMGVSGQAGKAKPVTGVILRGGADVSRDPRSGGVLAEILLGKAADPIAVVTSFVSPWPLARGGLFDVECRDPKTGDGAYLAVAPAGGAREASDLPESFFADSLFSPTGRFSFYGSPTDVRVRKSGVDGRYRYLEVSFSNLSQSTNSEIPRTALVSATIPQGSDSVVMLVGSATTNRWKRGSEGAVRDAVGSFRATLAPASGMKARAKGRADSLS